ncbi:briggsae CBR-PAH-1 protein [Syncephalis fuscata]|nr:briggsae CBR-PAH-1 protein [Syncephalis fuscata]
MNRIEQPISHPIGHLTDIDMKTQRMALMFSIDNQVETLANCLTVLQPFNISLARIESRPSCHHTHGQDMFIELLVDKTNNSMIEIQATLKKVAKNVRLVESNNYDLELLVNESPAFPRTAADLDEERGNVVPETKELEPDHPGFNDITFRQRRVEITSIANNYSHGDQLPRITYTPQEIATWRAVYRKTKELYPTHACREFRENFVLLEQHCGYSEDNIPQQADITEFLKKRTGFIMRPAMGVLTSRNFLNCLAFRVFCATQYIRYHSSPFYSVEPDLCHELFGHVALLADPNYAAFCQEIGLASLGASDEDIERLSALFMYTVEFGLCYEGSEVRAYGAGMLASIAELEHCLADNAKRVPFNPHEAATREYTVTDFQSVYFVADSLADVQKKVRAYLSTLNRPFDVHYDPTTESVVPVRKAAIAAKQANNDRQHQVPIAPAM